jgi:hypothetical protein
MEIISTRDAALFTGYFSDVSEHEYRKIDATQRTAKPTTNHEFALLAVGVCPECEMLLGGENGKFCVREQLWWEFELGQYFPVAPEPDFKLGQILNLASYQEET